MKTIYLASGILLAGAIGSVYRPAANVSSAGRNPTEAAGAAPAATGWQAALCVLSGTPSPKTGGCAPADIDNSYKPLTTAVAFIPDPYMTRLRLQFDRTIEAMIWAAQDSGFTSFRAQWIPWQRRNPEYSGLEDQKHSEEQQAALRKQPGVLVFSGPKQSLAVFLVGESPTHAFDPTQFRSALEQAGTWSSDGKARIRIIGPCFSGTFQPLLAALDWNGHQFEILTGTANSTDAELGFSEKVASHTGSSFHSFLHGEELRLLALEQYVHGPLHSRTAERAFTVLSEDETVFGSQTQGNFRFPRGIAYLRNAYQNNPALLSLSVDDSATPRRSLELNLKGPNTEHDTPPEFSQQTPVSAESQVRMISEHLYDDHVPLAVVIATDVLDTIFVAKFLKLSAPNTRQVLLDSDLLVGRSGDYPSLLGSLEVASYPQMTARRRWLKDGDKVAAASSEWEEGIYRAAWASFEGGLGTANPGLQPLGAGVKDPPLWLTVLGESQQWPVAILNDPPAKRISRLHDPFLPSPSEPAVQQLSSPPPSRIWRSLFRVGFVLTVAFLLIFIYAQWPHGMPARYDRPLCDLWIKPGEPAPSARAFYLLCLTLSLAALWLALSIGFLGYYRENQPVSRPLELALAVPLFLLLGLALWLTYSVLTLHTADSPRVDVVRRWHYQALTVIPWLLFAGLFVSQNRLLNVRAYFKSFFYSYRSLELGSGVSPVLPLLFLFLGLICWSVVQLQRRIFAEERYQLLPGNLSHHQIAASIQNLVRDVEENLECTFPRPYRGTVVATLLLLLSAFWITVRHFQSLEGRAYDIYYSAAAATLATLIFLSTWRFWNCWRRLQVLLEQLALHPVRWALRDLPVEHSWSPIWQSSPRKRVYVQLSRAVDCLRELRTLAARPASTQETELENASIVLLQCVAARKREEPELYRFLQDSLQALSIAAVDELNHGVWQEGSSETLMKLEEGSKQHTPANDDDNHGRMVTLAKEFVALRISSFVRYAMVQLRNLLTFVMLGFVLLVLSLGCYPFSSPSLLAWTLVGCLLATGVPIVLAFLEMGRDATLSWITDTKAGEVDKGPFLLRITTFGVLPLLSVVATHFPSVGQYVLSWLQPVVKALH